MRRTLSLVLLAAAVLGADWRPPLPPHGAPEVPRDIEPLDDATVELIASFLASPDRRVRGRAAWALGKARAGSGVLPQKKRQQWEK